MVLIGFATDRGFGHWSRMRNYITLPSLRDRSIMIAPITPASLSCKNVDTIGFVDPGLRMVMKDDGSYEQVWKYDPDLKFQGMVDRYYALPWILTDAYHAESLVIDAHNEPELLYCDEFVPVCRNLVAKAKNQGSKLFFTLETQSFPKLPLRYSKAFDLVEKIIIPYEREFFAKCVNLDPLEPYSARLEFVGNIISPDALPILRTKKDEARSKLKLPQDRVIIFCAYGRGEGATEIVSSIYRISQELRPRFPNLLFIISDPTGQFEKKVAKKPWLQFIGLDFQKAMTTLAACDYTIQGLGTSTLLETLVAGKPMISVSLDRPYEEQASKGRGVEAFELGVHIPLEKFSEKILEDSLLHVIREEPSRYRKRKSQIVLGNLNGADRMSNLLAKYIP